MIEKKKASFTINEESEKGNVKVFLSIDFENKSFEIKPHLGMSDKGFVFTRSDLTSVDMWKRVIIAIQKGIVFAEEILKFDNISRDKEFQGKIKNLMEKFSEQILNKKDDDNEMPKFISLESQFSESELNELKSGVDVETVILNRVQSKIDSQKGQELVNESELIDKVEKFIDRMNSQNKDFNIINVYEYMNSIFRKTSKEDHAIISNIINRGNWTLTEKVDIIRSFFPNYDTKENSSFLDDDFVIIRNLYFNKIKLKNDSRRPS